jgi:uncharacterized membrane-anchored protein
MGMDMDYGNGYAALKWTRSTDFAAWTWTVDMHGAWMQECRYDDKKLSPASLVFL